MERGRIEALKLRLKWQTAWTERDSVLREMLSVDEDDPALHELVSVLCELLRAGQRVNGDLLTDLIVKTRSDELYRSARSPNAEGPILTFDPIRASRLLAARIPDPEIEDWLCIDLERRWKEDIVWRKQIVEALKDHGSIDCLPVMYAIEYEFSGRFKAAKTISEAGADRDAPEDFESWERQVGRKVDIAFGELLREAIARISARGDPHPATAFGLHSAVKKRFARADEHLSMSKDADIAGRLNALRRALESVLKEVIKELRLPVKRQEPIDELALDVLMAIVQGGVDLPKPIRQFLQELQNRTTLGSHDQGDFRVEDLVPEDAWKGILATFGIVKNHFEMLLDGREVERC